MCWTSNCWLSMLKKNWCYLLTSIDFWGIILMQIRIAFSISVNTSKESIYRHLLLILKLKLMKKLLYSNIGLIYSINHYTIFIWWVLIFLVCPLLWVIFRLLIEGLNWFWKIFNLLKVGNKQSLNFMRLSFWII